MFGCPTNTSFRWTATESMFVDCGMKNMESHHFRRTLATGEWSYKYNAQFVKPDDQAEDQLSTRTACPERRIRACLQGLATKRGWHKRNNLAIQVPWGGAYEGLKAC